MDRQKKGWWAEFTYQCPFNLIALQLCARKLSVLHNFSHFAIRSVLFNCTAICVPTTWRFNFWCPPYRFFSHAMDNLPYAEALDLLKDLPLYTIDQALAADPSQEFGVDMTVIHIFSRKVEVDMGPSQRYQDKQKQAKNKS